jgi:hypothetical protein
MCIYIYIIYFQTFVLYGDVGVMRVCIVGANGHTCVFLGFSINVDIMQIYVVGADHLPSCFWWFGNLWIYCEDVVLYTFIVVLVCVCVCI